MLQTYYAADLEKLCETRPDWAGNCKKYTDIIREVASEMLNDNFTRWGGRLANVKPIAC